MTPVAQAYNYITSAKALRWGISRRYARYAAHDMTHEQPTQYNVDFCVLFTTIGFLAASISSNIQIQIVGKCT